MIKKFTKIQIFQIVTMVIVTLFNMYNFATYVFIEKTSNSAMSILLTYALFTLMSAPILSFTMFFTDYQDEPLLNNIKMSWTKENVSHQYAWDFIMFMLSVFVLIYILFFNINTQAGLYISYSILIYSLINTIMNFFNYKHCDTKLCNYIKI